MVYTAPSVGASGLSIPTYQDIEDYLVLQYRSIFGQDIYLENDSQDFQLIALQSALAYDTSLGNQFSYNSRSPLTAVGAGLDGVVSINGIKRKGATHSTATVTLTGTAFTQILNGLVADISGHVWELPDEVIIGISGTVSVTATCQDEGAILASPGQISKIQSPTNGWQTVTNMTAASAGQPVESDAELKARQKQSVANPSQALTDGILGGVKAVVNVNDAVLYENDTSALLYDINGAEKVDGFPPHSITMVVDGGEGELIAQAINNRKTPGCYTDGDQIYVVVENNQVQQTIRFYRPAETGIEVEIEITPLIGYTTALGAAIIEALRVYLTNLEIGQPVILSELWAVAADVNKDKRTPYSITFLQARRYGSGIPFTQDDIQLFFNERSTTISSFIHLTVNS